MAGSDRASWVDIKGRIQNFPKMVSHKDNGDSTEPDGHAEVDQKQIDARRQNEGINRFGSSIILALPPSKKDHRKGAGLKNKNHRLPEKWGGNKTLLLLNP